MIQFLFVLCAVSFACWVLPDSREPVPRSFVRLLLTLLKCKELLFSLRPSFCKHSSPSLSLSLSVLPWNEWKSPRVFVATSFFFLSFPPLCDTKNNVLGFAFPTWQRLLLLDASVLSFSRLCYAAKDGDRFPIVLPWPLSLFCPSSLLSLFLLFSVAALCLLALDTSRCISVSVPPPPTPPHPPPLPKSKDKDRRTR